MARRAGRAAGRPRRPDARGQVLVLFALGLVALLGAAGIAFDVGPVLHGAALPPERRRRRRPRGREQPDPRRDARPTPTTEARAVLATNLANGPNGIVARAPAGRSPVYAPGQRGRSRRARQRHPHLGRRHPGRDPEHGPVHLRARRRARDSVVGGAGPGRPAGRPPADRRPPLHQRCPGPNAGATPPVHGRPEHVPSTSSPPPTRPASAPRRTTRLRIGPDRRGRPSTPSNPATTRRTTARSSRSCRPGRAAATTAQTSAASSPSTSATSRSATPNVFYNDVTAGTQRTRSRRWRPAGSAPGGYPGPVSRRPPRRPTRTTRSP